MARALARMRFPDFQQVKSVVAIAQELPYVPPRA
jgi:hypothetical protein